MAQATWTAANDTEATLAMALARGDSPAYFRALAAAPLFLPDVDEPGPQQLVTVASGSDVYLLAFTSCEALAQRLPGITAFRTTTFAELHAKWPHSDWMLAVNPDTPIQAYAPIDVIVAAAAGRVVVPAIEIPASGPTNELETDLARAVSTGDVDAVIGCLVLAVVHVPVTPATGGWAPFADRTIAVFTSIEQLHAALPEAAPSVEAPFLDVVLDWPGPDWRLLVNPASTASLEFTGVQVAGFVEWAREFVAAPDRAPHPDPAEELLAVIPAVQVDGYLREARSDVTGLVFRASDIDAGGSVADLVAAADTPGVNDPLYVIRFAAHCPALFRPIRTPGSRSGWHAQAVVVSHGARLARLSRSARPAWLASFDADLRRWVPLHDADELHRALTT